MERDYDVIVVGAGAAGMTCAAVAGQRGLRVLVLDHARKIGEKIRISGGGRCNFTNTGTSSAHFLSSNLHFAKSALGRYTPSDFIALVDRYNISWHEKSKGQLFCDGSAQQIIDMLLSEMRDANVQLQSDTAITEISKTINGFEISTSSGTFRAEKTVIACGGKSIPKIGATGFGFDIARQFGLGIVETTPALVPLTFSSADLDRFKAMSGVSVPVRVSCNGVAFDEDMLFTHRGLSGPAILQISSYWRLGDAIQIHLAPALEFSNIILAEKKVSGRIAIQTVLSKFLPRRLALDISERFGFSGNIADMSSKDIGSLVALIENWQVKPTGTEGYRTAEVTRGGVDTNDLNAKTMEAKTEPGIYFIGEVVDVTGWLGGYNFQWAWASGNAAGQAV